MEESWQPGAEGKGSTAPAETRAGLSGTEGATRRLRPRRREPATAAVGLRGLVRRPLVPAIDCVPKPLRLSSRSGCFSSGGSSAGSLRSSPSGQRSSKGARASGRGAASRTPKPRRKACGEPSLDYNASRLPHGKFRSCPRRKGAGSGSVPLRKPCSHAPVPLVAYKSFCLAAARIDSTQEFLARKLVIPSRVSPGTFRSKVPRGAHWSSESGRSCLFRKPSPALPPAGAWLSPRRSLARGWRSGCVGWLSAPAGAMAWRLVSEPLDCARFPGRASAPFSRCERDIQPVWALWRRGDRSLTGMRFQATCATSRRGEERPGPPWGALRRSASTTRPTFLHVPLRQKDTKPWRAALRTLSWAIGDGVFPPASSSPPVASSRSHKNRKKKTRVRCSLPLALSWSIAKDIQKSVCLSSNTRLMAPKV